MSGPYVVDASVILKWLLPSGDEPWVNAAHDMFRNFQQGRIDVTVPALWWYEVGNILSRKYPEQAAAQLTLLGSILGEGFSVSSASMRTQTFDLVHRFRVTFYDASYHALAIVNDGVLVTADEKYLQAVAGESHIMHLNDWN